MEFIIDNKTNNEILEELERTADYIKEEKYEAPLSQDEIDDVKTNVTRLGIKMQQYQDEKDEFMARWNPIMKEAKADFNLQVSEARSGQRTEEGKVYYIADQVAGTMTRIVENGLVIGTRPLKADERSETIFKSIRATGTNGK